MTQYLDKLGGWLQLSDTQMLWLKIGIGILAVAVVLWVIQRIVMYVRSLVPARVNPKLARYAADDEAAIRQRQQLATTIKSTASGEQVPGYRIIQAVEALYVDGFRTPQEALEGLKAAAAAKGANAVINVRHERSSLGRCSASGDAVVVETTGQAYTPPSQPIEIPLPETPQKIERKKPDGPMIR